MLRLKRWLIAGQDDSRWGEEGRRTFHRNLGGKFLHEFAEGLSEEDCDRIANSEAPRGVMIAYGIWPGRCCSSLRLPSLDSRH